MYCSGTALLDPYRVLLQTDIRSGHRVADFGSGKTGHFTFPLAVAVGEEGRVYAIDIKKEHLGMIEGTRRTHALHHIEPVWADIEDTTGLPAESVDVVFIVDMLRVLQNLKHAIKEARRILVPRGKIVVIDWSPRANHPVAPPLNARFHPRDVDLVFLQCGCAVMGNLSPSAWHWGRVYRA